MGACIYALAGTMQDAFVEGGSRYLALGLLIAAGGVSYVAAIALSGAFRVQDIKAALRR